jgi:hypothetical protein
MRKAKITVAEEAKLFKMQLCQADISQSSCPSGLSSNDVQNCAAFCSTMTATPGTDAVASCGSSRPHMPHVERVDMFVLVVTFRCVKVWALATLAGSAWHHATVAQPLVQRGTYLTDVSCLHPT